MRNFIVNQLHQTPTSAHFVALIEQHIFHNIREMFGQDAVNKVAQLLAQEEVFYHISRYDQFVEYFRVDPIVGPTLSLSDFHNNIDNALEYYNNQAANNWSKEDREKFISVAQDIIENPPVELATVEKIELF